LRDPIEPKALLEEGLPMAQSKIRVAVNGYGVIGKRVADAAA
jgi:hypothetical protein